MIVYLDSSAVLRVILGQRPTLAGWGNWDAAYSSEILRVETRRTLDRLRLAGALDDAGVADAVAELGRVERTIGIVRIGRRILDRAGEPMATAVRTLDALHLASALAVRQRRAGDLLFATHDARQALAARALGFTCVGV
ncbi:PIN domain-containing protein [bacterium]|nr:PIN domain-containing protein [bacterium]